MIALIRPSAVYIRSLGHRPTVTDTNEMDWPTAINRALAKIAACVWPLANLYFVGTVSLGRRHLAIARSACPRLWMWMPVGQKLTCVDVDNDAYPTEQLRKSLSIRRRNGERSYVMVRIIALLLANLAFAHLLPAQSDSAASSPHRVRLAPAIETTSGSAQRWYPRPLTTHNGTVTQFDGDQIAILIDGQTVPTRFASQRVLEIESAETPEDQAVAIDLFRRGDFAAALPALVRSVSDHDASSRPPVWRQQWLSMLAAQAAMRSGRGDIAIELVAQLDARPLPAMTLGLLPIDWTGSIGGNDPRIDVAAARASSDSLAVKLVVASWLLRSPKYRSAAESAVQRLAAQRDRPWIATLAGQLIWRTRPPPEIEANLTRIEQEIDALPMAFQTGPMISLLNLARDSGSKDAVKKWDMVLEMAAPTWHPDQ